MKDFILYLFLAPLGLSLQATLFKGIRPDFVLVLVCCYSLRHGQNKGMAYGALTGFLIDSLSGFILGPNIFSKSMAGLLVGVIREKVFYWNIVLNTIVIIILSLLDIFVVRICFEIFSELPINNTPLEALIFQIFYTSAFSLLMYPIFNRGDEGKKFKLRGAMR
ncbi:MAG: rod shape-determining protein MreD [Nitrospirae bacterium]|nr:rod shape-determining protein MreD [Nitrospirota bacterium]